MIIKKSKEENMKKIVSLIIMFLILCIHTLSFADVGSFESYDSWDSSSDWSSGSWDSDWRK